MDRPEWMRRADERLLHELHEEGPDYLALVANRLGMPLGYVERRTEHLVDQGLVEPVTDEAIYRTTAAGERLLADDTEQAHQQTAQTD